MVRLRQRGIPKSDDGVPFILVDSALFLEDDVGHVGQIVIEQRGEIMGIQAFRDRGKALEIREEYTQFPSFASQLEARRLFQEAIDHHGAQVVLESMSVKRLLAALGDIIEPQGANHGNPHGKFLDDHRPPEPSLVGRDPKNQWCRKKNPKGQDGMPRLPAVHHDYRAQYGQH